MLTEQEVKSEINTWLKSPKNETEQTLQAYIGWVINNKCKIRSSSGSIIPFKFRYAQLLLLHSIIQQAHQNKPIRQIVLKGRKCGSTTFFNTLFYFLSAHYANKHAIIVAHETTATAAVYEQQKIMASNYEGEYSLNKCTFPNGSKTYCRTMGGYRIGAGSTIQYVLLSEAAKYNKQGEENLWVLNNSVPEQPGTFIILESTAHGQNFFYKKYLDSCQPDQTYSSVFIPWFLDPEAKSNSKFSINDELLDIINKVKTTYNITLSKEQISFYNRKLNDYGSEITAQEYPTLPEDALRQNKDLILKNIRKNIISGKPELSNNKLGGADFGCSSTDATVLVHAYEKDNILYVYKISHLLEPETDDVMNEVIPGTRYYCDPSALKWRNDLSSACSKNNIRASFPIAQKNKDVVHQWNHLSQQLNAGKILFYSECDNLEQLIKEADTLSWKNGKPNMVRTNETYHYDTLDALRYMCCSNLILNVEPITLNTTRREHKTKLMEF